MSCIGRICIRPLAYAMLADVRRVDTFLVYPEPEEDRAASFALADVVAGERYVRLGLGSIPFGFRGAAEREAVTAIWEQTLRSSPRMRSKQN